MSDKLLEAIQLYKLGKYRQSLLILKKIKTKFDNNHDVQYYLGLCHAKLSEWDEAVFFLENAVSNLSDALRVYQSRIILSYIYTTTDKLRLAEFELKKLYKDGYESPQVYCNFSYIYYKTGNIEKSMFYLNEALDLDPDNATALNSLGYILAENDINLGKAMDLCKKALKIKPDCPAYLDSIGWIYYKNKQNEEARYFLKRAYDIDPQNRIIANHLKTVLKGIEGN